jgi:hypothetical protein
MYKGKIEPVFKLPFDITLKLAQEARKYKPVNKKQTASEPAACPIALGKQKTRTMPLERRGFLFCCCNSTSEAGLEGGG